MLSYIPHKNNTHSWKTFIFIFLILTLSSFLTFIFIDDNKNKEIVLNNEVAAFENDSQKNKNIDDENIFYENNNIVLNDIENANKKDSEIIINNNDIEVNNENKKSEEEVVVISETPKERILEIKKYAKPVILQGKYIDISLKYQNMIIFENGEALDVYLISSGKKGLDTPVGTYRIENKAEKAWSKTYGLWMPKWMAITADGKVGIHELPVWPGGYQEGANHLGTAVSHGCVRLGKNDAKRVYDWTEIGTTVVVHK